jgi:RHS repeat-associated protein
LNVWEVKEADADTEAVTFGSLSLNALKTSYQYDTLNNLITVNQGVQTRSFAYNSLSRLKSANNPESGLINYIYDNNGNLTSKTDVRSITTSYVYDVLNRVKNRNYSDSTTPNVAYTYDNGTNAKGKLTKVTTAATATNQLSETKYNSFDILGRVLSHSQITDGNTYNSSYVYNLSGALIEETYPSGRVVKNTLDADGDLAQVKSKKLNDTFKNYANAFTYTSAGAVSSLRLGNGKFENTTFNSRLQPTQIGLGSSATSQNLLKLNFDYGVADNNGNVKSQQITVQQSNQTPLVLNQSYMYDSLNRLKSAEEKDASNVTVWKQTYTFDRYGNRNFDVANTTTLGQNFNANISNPTVNVANNRFTTGQGYVYDLSGNIIQDAEGRSFVYDAENKQKSVSSASNPNIGTYFFDGDGKRVKKISPTETTIFVYDAGGKLVAEYSTQQADTPKINYTTNDHLGSPRITTDQNGQVISRTDYQPYGEEIASTQRTANLGYTVQDSVKQGFTGYIKDDETGLDYAQARMYKNSLGRFTGVDAILMKEDRLRDPQQINLYGYVRNNPLAFVDPTGLDFEFTGKDKDKFLADANNRDKAQFQIKLNDKGIVEVIDKGKVDVSKLTKSEAAMFNAINDKENHATLNGIDKDSGIDFGGFKGNGTNVIDTSDMALLRNADKALAGNVISHEMMEAYASAKSKNSDYNAAHSEASSLFSEAVASNDSRLPGEENSSSISGASVDYTVTRDGKSRSVRVEYKFLKKLSENDFDGTLPPGNITKIKVIKK